MKISDLIIVKSNFELLEIINSANENPLNWLLQPLNEKVIPSEGHFLVKSQEILDKKERLCWMTISTPEMAVDYVFTIDANSRKIVLNDYHLLADKVVPNKLSNVFADYELYYARKKPSVGIKVLKKEIENVTEKGLVCEYLGYIFRDEKKKEEALKWFLKSLEFGTPSSEYIYEEIAALKAS